MAYRLSLATQVSQKILKNIPQCRRISSYFQPSESEYVDQPVYPPILDMSRDGVKARQIEAVAQKITNLPTVEEKLIELNEPKYWGWWACQLREDFVPYNALPFAQFATRTCLVPGSPDIYKDLEARAQQLIPAVKGPLCDLILQMVECASARTNRYNQTKSQATEENRFSRDFTPVLNRLMMNLVSPQNQHLNEMELDSNPRIEASWFLGGIEPSKATKKCRENDKFYSGKVDDPVDRPIKYVANPCLTLRHHNPLPQLMDRDSGLSVEGVIPEWKHDPRVLTYKFKHSRSCNTPGFWPGTKLQHGYLSMLHRGHMKFRDVLLNSQDHQEGLHSAGIFYSFAWTLAQACYLGFGPYTELTYPVTTQTIITNGRQFSLYAYQMNTCALYSKNSSDANPHRNVCFGSDELNLYDVVENGQVKGFNDDVLTKLISFYLAQPVEPKVNLRPYLSEEKYIANVEDTMKRKHVEQIFKHLMSNRPRLLVKDEIMPWEKIYKVDHNTRPIDPKRRFFERKEPAPDMKRLHDYDPPFVPRAIRGKKSRRGRLPVQPTIKL